MSVGLFHLNKYSRGERYSFKLVETTFVAIPTGKYGISTDNSILSELRLDNVS